MRYEDFREANAEILAISVDSVNVHKAWNESELSKMAWGGIPYPMLEDKGAKIGQMYDCYDDKGGVNFRATYLIDPDGMVQSAEIMYPAAGRNTDEIMRQLRAYQHNRKTGELLPVGWTVGEQTLVKTPAVAGHVWEQWAVEN